jgi:hypothetical protein
VGLDDAAPLTVLGRQLDELAAGLGGEGVFHHVVSTQVVQVAGELELTAGAAARGRVCVRVRTACSKRWCQDAEKVQSRCGTGAVKMQ